MSGPSPHLSWDELKCSDGTPYPEAWRSTRGAALAAAFEELRRQCGNVPLTILSAYRTHTQNTAVGGAPHSQHLLGTALDIAVPKSLTYGNFLAAIFRTCDIGLIRGVGIYSHMQAVHVDIRPGALVVWVKP